MRILHLTPGTGNFYCGSCLRDNTLVLALRKLGHDAVMVPLYLPHVTEGPGAAPGAPVRMGGVNIYLQEKFAFFRRAPRWLGRMLDAPFLLRLAARRAGMTAARDLGAETVSVLAGEEGRHARELEKLIDWMKGLRPPDAVLLSNSMLAGTARRIRGALGVPVISSLQGEDAFLDALPDPHRQRAWETLRARARDVAAFIAPSRFYAERMADRLGVDRERVHVIMHGIDVEGYEPAQVPPSPPVIAFLSRMHETKGLAELVNAFVLLKRRDRIKGLRLCVIGSRVRSDDAYMREVCRPLIEHGLHEEVRFHPNVSRGQKQALLRSCSLLSVPALEESFGLYVPEALASGLPVVLPARGAFPELIEATGGGILFDPDDGQALARSIEDRLADPDRARAIGARGRAAVLESFTAERMAREVAELCRRIAG